MDFKKSNKRQRLSDWIKSKPRSNYRLSIGDTLSRVKDLNRLKVKKKIIIIKGKNQSCKPQP